MDRPMPMTYERAATAVVQCRSLLDKARTQLDVAVEILRGLEGQEEGLSVGSLEQVLVDIQRTELALVKAWPRSETRPRPETIAAAS